MKKIIGCLSICCLVAGCPQTDAPDGGGDLSPQNENPADGGSVAARFDSGLIEEGPLPDAGQPFTETTDAGHLFSTGMDAGQIESCAANFVDALQPHLDDLVVIQGESDSVWTNFLEDSDETDEISLSELRSLFALVGSSTYGVTESDWDARLEWLIEDADDPQAAQATLDAVESVFESYLTHITFVHFGADDDVEHYFLRVGRSECGEILGLWTVVIWT